MRLAHVLADQADSISLDRFKAQDLKVDTKPDLTPVTDADRAVEEMLRITLSRARTRDAVMGEEFGTTGHGPRRWVLDPIDGTKNFVRGVPVWATLIALLRRRRAGRRAGLGPGAQPPLVGGEGRRRVDRPPAGVATRCHVSEVSELADASLSYSSLSGWEERERPRRLPRPHPVGLAHPRLRRLLELRAARRGRGRHRLRARGLAVGPRRARRDRPGGRRPVHRPHRRRRARPAAARWPPTAPCTTPRSTSSGCPKTTDVRLAPTGPARRRRSASARGATTAPAGRLRGRRRARRPGPASTAAPIAEALRSAQVPHRPAQHVGQQLLDDAPPRAARR